MPPSRENTSQWLLASHPTIKQKAFQLIDSLYWYWQGYGHVPSIMTFQTVPELGTNSGVLQAFMASQAANLPQEMAHLDMLRPVQYPRLPVLRFSLAALPVADMLKVKDLDNNKDYAMVLSYDHALRLDDELNRMNNKRGNTAGFIDIKDFPATHAEQKEMVDDLFAAMIDTSEVVETDHITSKKRKAASEDDQGDQGAEPSEGPFYTQNYKVARVLGASNVELQILAWKLLFGIKDAQKGDVLLRTLHNKAPTYQNYGSFSERYEAVKATLKNSKSLVEGLMFNSPLRRLAAAPAKEYKKKNANKQSNDKRNAQVKMGISALNSGLYEKTAEGKIVDKEGKEIVPAPTISSLYKDKDTNN